MADPRVHRGRGPHRGVPPSMMSAGSTAMLFPIGRIPSTRVVDPGRPPAKKKTKVILILGIVLPVVACVIGIAAWAVTTDVLRFSPRDSFSRNGQQGKTRVKDNIQSRSDNDVDIFLLHGITPSTTPLPILSTRKTSVTQRPSPKSPAMTKTPLMANPKPSDILSKLLSETSSSKNPTQFVVFAPVADTTHVPTTMNLKKGKSLDSKFVIHDSDDLVAEESVVSEEISQEHARGKIPYSRKRKSSGERSSQKHGGDVLIGKKMLKDRTDNLKFPTVEVGSDRPQQFAKKHNKADHFVRFPSHSISGSKVISNRNGSGVLLQKSSSSIQPPSQAPSLQANSDSNVPLIKLLQYQRSSGSIQPPSQGPSLQTNSDSNVPLTNLQQFQKSSGGIQPPSQAPSLQVNVDSNVPLTNHGLPQFKSRPGLNFQNVQPLNQVVDTGRSPVQNHQPPPFQSPPYKPPQYQESHNYKYPNIQHGSPPFQDVQPLHYQGPNQQAPPNYQQNNQYLGPPPQAMQGSQASFNGQSHYPQGSYSLDNVQLPNNSPQYFAPPPQNFHTKTSYDKPSQSANKHSMTSYERLAQSSIDHKSKEGSQLHHHHHHHHHHSESGTDGEVNLSDVPRTNDADRLGTIGIGTTGHGSGRQNGITLQIGGGVPGLGALLPLSALGIARNIVASLLPRPRLGLNSKVFLGFEVGRGGGLTIG